MTSSPLLIVALLLGQTAATPDVVAYRTDAEARARLHVQSVLDSVCAGRCQLLAVLADVEAEKVMADSLPGFESLGREETRYVTRALHVRVLVDAAIAPATQQGLKAAIETALAELADMVEVDQQSMPWPAPPPQPQAPTAALAPLPVVVQVKPGDGGTSAASTAGAGASVKPAGAEEPTAAERLAWSLISGLPMIVAAALVALGLALGLRQAHAGGATRRTAALLPPGAGAGAELRERGSNDGAGVSGAAIGKPTIPESALLAQCRADRALAAAVLRRALRARPPAVAADFVMLLGEESIAVLMGDVSLRGPLVAMLQALRVSGARRYEDLAAHLAELEAMILDERDAGWHDARFAFLQGLSQQAFAALLSQLSEAERTLLLLLAPAERRAAVLSGLTPSARAGFLTRSLALPSEVQEHDLGALAAKTEPLAREVRDCEQREHRAAALLEEQLTAVSSAEQTTLLHGLAAESERWAAIIASEVVTDEQLLQAPEETIDALVVAVPPESLLAFLQAAEPAVRARIVPRLPVYLAEMWRELRGVASPPAAARDARRQVFEAFRRLSGDGRPATESRTAAARGRAKVAS